MSILEGAREVEIQRKRMLGHDRAKKRADVVAKGIKKELRKNQVSYEELYLDNTGYKLSLVLLVYVYSQDEKISSKEQSKFYEFIGSIDTLSITEKEDLTSMLRQLPTLDYVVNYIKEQNITYKKVQSAIDFLNATVKLGKKEKGALTVVKYKCEKLLKQ